VRNSYDESDVGRLVGHLADRIAAAFPAHETLNIVGIRTRGEVLAQRLTSILQSRGYARIGRGVLDITLYRDDLQTIGPRPVVGPTSLPWGVEGMNVVIVDDVLYTGRTIRAAPWRSRRRPSLEMKIGPAARSPTARSTARAARGPGGW